MTAVVMTGVELRISLQRDAVTRAPMVRLFASQASLV
jgi:hypothetical protein